MYPRQVTEVDELIIDATQSDVLDEDILRLMEKAYVVLESMSIEAIIVSLEQRKIIQLTKEPIKLTDLERSRQFFHLFLIDQGTILAFL